MANDFVSYVVFKNDIFNYCTIEDNNDKQKYAICNYDNEYVCNNSEVIISNPNVTIMKADYDNIYESFYKEDEELKYRQQFNNINK